MLKRVTNLQHPVGHGWGLSEVETGTRVAYEQRSEVIECLRRPRSSEPGATNARGRRPRRKPVNLFAKNSITSARVNTAHGRRSRRLRSDSRRRVVLA